MTRVLVPLANGSEELEAVAVIDVLRRAGWTVTAAGVDGGLLTLSRGVKLQPDAAWAGVDPEDYDMLVLPGGGPGTERLAGEHSVLEAVRRMAAAGILAGKRVTCYPGCERGLEGCYWTEERVVVDGKLVTSRGPGTALEFALALVRAVDGERAAARVAAGMLAV